MSIGKLPLKKKFDSVLSTRTFYIYLLICFFVFYNLREIDYLVLWDEMIWPSAILLFASFVLFFLTRQIIKDSHKAAALTFLMSGIVLFYNDLYFIINAAGDELPFRNRHLILIYAGLVTIAGITLYFSKKSFRRLTHYLNVLLLLLCLYEILLFVQYKAAVGNKWSCYISAEDKQHKTESANVSDKNDPDIYLIIADAYTNSASLKEFWNFDNRKFMDSLRAAGFYTPLNAKSNYANTPYCLSSLLNGKYLPDIESGIPNPLARDLVLRAMINSSSFISGLCSRGYVLKNLSLFNLNGDKKYYTYDHFSMPDYSSFSDKLLDKTFFFWFGVYGKMVYDPGLIKELADSTISISTRKQTTPVFVYTHFPIPHGPFHFNERGEVALSKLGDEMEAYLEQLKYTNKVILRIVKELQSNSVRQSIILVMGDHGTRTFMDDPQKKYESYTAFTSLYLPNNDYGSLYDSISHVNIFPVIFNAYFNGRYPILRDTQGFSNEKGCKQ